MKIVETNPRAAAGESSCCNFVKKSSTLTAFVFEDLNLILKKFAGEWIILPLYFVQRNRQVSTLTFSNLCLTYRGGSVNRDFGQKMLTVKFIAKIFGNF